MIHFQIRFSIHHNLILTLSNKKMGCFIWLIHNKYTPRIFIGPLESNFVGAVISEANIILDTPLCGLCSQFVCSKIYRWKRVQFGWSFPKNPTAYIWHRKSFSLPCICAVCSCHGALRWGETRNDLHKLSIYSLETVNAN